MKTDELISLLAQGNPGVDLRAPLRRFVLALAIGLSGAIVMAILIFGRQADVGYTIHQPMFWWKLAFAASIATAALVMTQRLARPGRQLGRTWLGLSIPIAVAAGAAAVIMILAPFDERLSLIQGGTWRTCSLLIALLSGPAFLSVLWAIKAMAPTRSYAAGAAGGLLAGAIATIVYSVYCSEMEVPFWTIWYMIGMLIPAAAGAILGPRLLRW